MTATGSRNQAGWRRAPCRNAGSDSAVPLLEQDDADIGHHDAGPDQRGHPDPVAATDERVDRERVERAEEQTTSIQIVMRKNAGRAMSRGSHCRCRTSGRGRRSVPAARPDSAVMWIAFGTVICSMSKKYVMKPRLTTKNAMKTRSKRRPQHKRFTSPKTVARSCDRDNPRRGVFVDPWYGFPVYWL